ncbi:MAG: ABC transporter permease [Deltaproteobacteria bacterium]|nr:ABC transporter permease [Deltaproteobacteria bacterium]
MIESWWWDLLLAALRAATPLIFCALGILVAERAGVLHIGVEGVMLAGALAAIIGTVLGGNPWAGMLATISAGIIAGIILAFISVSLPTDQVVIGIAFNLVSLGATSFIFRLLAKQLQVLVPAIPPLLFGLSPFTLAAIVLIVVMWWFLFWTGPGLKLRSVGENTHAAHASGINVVYVRFAALIIASVLAALGGAALTMGWVRSFTDNVTLGRGFIALAAVYFGRWNPLLALGACLIFGAGEALAFRGQGTGAGLNPHYYLMLPYILTLLVVGLAGMARGPGDAGKPYLRR